MYLWWHMFVISTQQMNKTAMKYKFSLQFLCHYCMRTLVFALEIDIWEVDLNYKIKHFFSVLTFTLSGFPWWWCLFCTKQLDLVLKAEEGGDISNFITNGEWFLIGKLNLFLIASCFLILVCVAAELQNFVAIHKKKDPESRITAKSTWHLHLCL